MTLTPWLFLDWEGWLAFVGTESEVLSAQFDYLQLGRQCLLANLDVGTPGGMLAINERVMRSRVIGNEAVGAWCATLSEYVRAVGSDSPLAFIPPPTNWDSLRTNPLGGVRWWRFLRPTIFAWQTTAVHAYFATPAPVGADVSIAWAETKRAIVLEADSRCMSTPSLDWITALAELTIREHPAINATFPLPDSLLTHRTPYRHGDVR
jgi:hypothetical protein